MFPKRNWSKYALANGVRCGFFLRKKPPEFIVPRTATLKLL
jgi:hypothetical protein